MNFVVGISLVYIIFMLFNSVGCVILFPIIKKNLLCEIWFSLISILYLDFLGQKDTLLEGNEKFLSLDKNKNIFFKIDLFYSFTFSAMRDIEARYKNPFIFH